MTHPPDAKVCFRGEAEAGWAAEPAASALFLSGVVIVSRYNTPAEAQGGRHRRYPCRFLDRPNISGSVAVSAINVVSHPRAWVGITVAVAAAAAFALANTSATVAYHGGSNPLTVAATRLSATQLLPPHSGF